MESILKSVREASWKMSQLTNAQKNQALQCWNEILREKMDWLVSENEKDQIEQKEKLSLSSFQRLILTKEKLNEIMTGIVDLQAIPDPIGIRTLHRQLDEGLVLERVSTPIGVIGVIFESRPDAAIQIASLILKSGNAGVLKGGKEARHTIKAIGVLIKQIHQSCEFLPFDWLHFIGSREEVATLLEYHQYINLIIPRGSNHLVQSVMAQTKIPVLGHADGICHLYLHQDFDLPTAFHLIVDAKTQYPAACNSIETLLVDEKFYAPIIEILKADSPQIELLENPSSWSIEYGDLRLAVKSVKTVKEAIDHINQYGSHHTDGILTHNENVANQFLRKVDSANVFVNCSTRFSDGFRYGFGAEVGISTNKTHARGPVGLEGLTIYKYLLRGHGQKVSDYSGPDRKNFFHRDLDF